MGQISPLQILLNNFLEDEGQQYSRSFLFEDWLSKP